MLKKLESKTVVLRLELILTINGNFCCDIPLLFYGTALKFLMELVLKLRLIP